MTYVVLNNQLVRKAEASISVEDRGFRFGDGVFETIRIHQSRPCFWEQHKARLDAGLQGLRISADTNTLHSAALTLIEKNQVEEGILRIAISRGCGSIGYLPLPNITPTILLETLPPRPVSNEPITLWLSSYTKPSKQSLPIQHKLMQGLNSTLARMEAQEHGCGEALLLNAHGHITEASASNIFWFREGTLYTPALTCGLVAGIIRQQILALSPYKIIEGTFLLEELKTAEEVFLTNASALVILVNQLQPAGMEWRTHSVAEKIKGLIVAKR